MQWFKKNKKLIQAVLMFLGIMGGLCLLLYQPLMQLLQNPQLLKSQLESLGIAGKLLLCLIMGLQVTFAFLPGEIIEVLAGVIYGPIEGMLLCLVGAAIGSALIYLFVAHFGLRFIDRFAGLDKIRELQFLKQNKKLPFVVFLLFFIPGTPKDLMTYVMPLTSMKLSTFLMISSVARIPSVITSTFAGDSLMQQNTMAAVLIFAITGILSLLGIALYQKIIQVQNKKVVNHCE